MMRVRAVTFNIENLTRNSGANLKFENSTHFPQMYASAVAKHGRENSTKSEKKKMKRGVSKELSTGQLVLAWLGY